MAFSRPYDNENPRAPKPRTEPEAALQKLRNWCALQERSHKEVKDKLYGLGLYPSEVDEATAALIMEGYLNEGRYAETLAGGKHRIKGWGRTKVVQRLKQNNVSLANIKNALQQLQGPDYEARLHGLVARKNTLLRQPDPMKRKASLLRYAIGKGYEQELAWRVVNAVLGEAGE